MSERLGLPLGEAMFSQRAIRRFKPDPIPEEDLRDILAAAGRAPSASNQQPWRFVVVRNPELKLKLQECYQAAWWARRKSTGINRPEDIPVGDNVMQAALRFTREYASAPALILVCSVASPIENEILTACQNLLLAARALGIGGTLTSLGGPADQPVHDIFGIPTDVAVRFCIPLGYPLGRFGPAQRKPLSELAFGDRWGQTL